LMECFLTMLASIKVYGHATHLSDDGFTGLQAVSVSHFLTWDWEWLKYTTWGGALMTQLHSARCLFSTMYAFIENNTQRTWLSSPGSTPQAVVTMIDNAARLPVFDYSTREEADEALKRFPEFFSCQPWMGTAAQAEKDVRELLRFYNTQAQYPFLAFVAS